MATAANTTLKIEFSGLVTHLLGSHNKRAVCVRERDHEGKMEIPADRVLETNLRTIFGSVHCRGGWCSVPLEGWAVQFTSNGIAVSQPADVKADDPTFDKLVPHLKKVTGNKFATVKAKANLPTPPVSGGTPISAWISLPPGSFTATPFQIRARFVPDHERAGWRHFGKLITLTSSIEQPGIQVANEVENGKPKWIPLPLHGEGELAIKIANEPRQTIVNPTEIHATAHFAANFELAGETITEDEYRPRIDFEDMPGMTMAGMVPSSGARANTNAIQRAVHMIEVPGCSNSQWP